MIQRNMHPIQNASSNFQHPYHIVDLSQNKVTFVTYQRRLSPFPEVAHGSNIQTKPSLRMT